MACEQAGPGGGGFLVKGKGQVSCTDSRCRVGDLVGDLQSVICICRNVMNCKRQFRSMEPHTTQLVVGCNSVK